LVYDPIRHNRRSIRLKDYDYTKPGAYFVTICTMNLIHQFGEVIDGEISLSSAGEMVEATWHEIPPHYPHVEIDTFVIMPNHIHGIIILLEDDPVGAVPCDRPKAGQPQGVAPTLSLPEVIHRFKSLTTERYIDGVKYSGWPPFPGHLWQRNYWEHIIRNHRVLDAVRRYIKQNPMRWDMDRYNANAIGLDQLAEQLWKTLKASTRSSNNP